MLCHPHDTIDIALTVVVVDLASNLASWLMLYMNVSDVP